MSVAELHREITALSPGKQRSVAKYVAYLKRRDTPARRRLLTGIGRDMDAGKKYSQAQVDAALAKHPPRR